MPAFPPEEAINELWEFVSMQVLIRWDMPLSLKEPEGKWQSIFKRTVLLSFSER